MTSPAPVGTETAGVAPEPTLIVTGSIHYDLILRLPRLPRPNDRLAPTGLTFAPGGMGGNVAAAVARLGGRVRFAGAFARDDDGAALRADLAREGVEVGFAGARDAAAGKRGFILVGEDGERAILGWPNDAEHPERSPGQPPALVHTAAGSRHPGERRRDRPFAASAGVFAPPVAGFACPADYAPAALPHLPPGLPLFVDVETGHVDGWDVAEVRALLRRATVVFANEENAALLAARLGGATVADVARQVGDVLVVTRGRVGCAVYRGGRRLTADGFRVEAVDTTGAGDCFAAAFALATLRGRSLAEAARFANGAAALSTRALGSRPGVPTAAELAAFLRDRPDEGAVGEAR